MEKRRSSFKILLAAVGVIAAVAAGISFLLYHFAREKAYNEKWKDYIDCGL